MNYCARFEQLLLVLLAVFYPLHHLLRSPVMVNLSSGDPLIAVTGLLIVVGLVGTNHYPRLIAPVTVFVGAVSISTILILLLQPAHLDAANVLSEYVKLLGSVAWFVGLCALLIRRPRHHVWIFAVVSLAVASVLATGTAIQTVLGVRRPPGPFENPNLYADYLIFALALCALVATEYLSVDRPRRAALAVLPIPMLFVSLLGTQSRSALGALGVGVVFIGALVVLREDKHILWRHLAIAIGGAGALGALVIFMDWGIAHRFATLADGQSTGGRLDLWILAIRRVVASPFVGIGLGNLQNVIQANGLPPTAHNTHVRFLVETGAIGFAGFAYFVYSTSLKSVRRAIHARPSSIFLGAYLITVFANGFFHGIINFRSFWIALAMFGCWTVFVTGPPTRR